MTSGDDVRFYGWFADAYEATTEEPRLVKRKKSLRISRVPERRATFLRFKRIDDHLVQPRLNHPAG
jgi:hypothetical protein